VTELTFTDHISVTGNESVPMQLAQCRFHGLVISNAEILIYFSNRIYTEATLSNSTRKLLWFEISKTPIAVKNKFIVLFIIM